MKLSKMQNQTEISFLDKFAEEAVEKKAEKVEKEVEYIQQPAQKLDNSKAIDNRSGHGILNAGGGGIKDTGGPVKHMGSLTNNSIWDSEVIKKMTETQDNGERLKEQNAELQKVRNGIRQDTLDNLAKAISETDTRKASSIANTSGGEESSAQTYKKPTNNLSIFDDNSKEAFERLAEKTGGEKISERAATPKEKEDSWRKQNSGTKKMSSLMDSLFDNLTKEEKK